MLQVVLEAEADAAGSGGVILSLECWEGCSHLPAALPGVGNQRLWAAACG